MYWLLFLAWSIYKLPVSLFLLFYQYFENEVPLDKGLYVRILSYNGVYQAFV